MAELPVFGSVERCPSCGVSNLHETYFNSEFRRRHSTDTQGHEKDASYIERTCLRCNYTWQERPLYMKEENGSEG